MAISLQIYRVRILTLAVLATAYSWVRSLISRFLFQGNTAPRPGDVSLSPLWVQGVLRENGYKGVVVQGLKVGDNENNRGLAGAISKVEVVYAPECSKTSGLPTRLLLKMTKSGLEGRAIALTFRAYREAQFFNSNEVELVSASLGSSAPSKKLNADGSVDVKSTGGLYPHALSKAFKENAPFTFYAYCNSWLGEAVILQEDISFKPKCAPMNFIFGNQIWGVPKPVEPERNPAETLKTVFTSIAKYHASFWNNKQLLTIPWLKGVDWFNGRDRSHWEIAITSSRVHWASAKLKVAKPDSGLKLDPKLSAIFDKSLEMSTWDGLQSYIKSHPFTLTHGDFHASNMFVYRASDDSDVDIPLWFDWSEVGPGDPAADLAQMIISDVRPEVFTVHSKDIAKAYYDTLIKSGVSEKEYPWQMFWNNYTTCGVGRWIWLITLLADYPLPPAFLQYFLDQTLAFINHHSPNVDHFPLRIVATCI